MNDSVSVYLRNMGNVKLGAVLLLASFAVNAPLVVLMEVFPPSVPESGQVAMQQMGIFAKLLIGSVVVPVIETAVFQLAPVWLLRRLLGLPWPLVILASAALFASAHLYSHYYMVFGFLIGLVFVYAFSIRDRSDGAAFVLVCIVHGLRNLIASLVL